MGFEQRRNQARSDCQLKAVKDHNGRRRKKALKKLSPVQLRNQILNDHGNSPTYTLELKPRNPEQPRKRNESKQLNFN